MSKIKFEPVRWATRLFVFLTALIGANELYPIIPEKWTPWILFAEALLALVLGRQVRNAVTPLAAPKTPDGRPAILLPRD